jgi:hypothetical protein
VEESRNVEIKGAICWLKGDSNHGKQSKTTAGTTSPETKTSDAP